MIICLCNNFNEKTLKEGIKALAENLPENPSLEQLENFYHDVYAYCGQFFENQTGKKPECYSCFDSFIDMTLREIRETEKEVKPSPFLTLLPSPL